MRQPEPIAFCDDCRHGKAALRVVNCTMLQRVAPRINGSEEMKAPIPDWCPLPIAEEPKPADTSTT